MGATGIGSWPGTDVVDAARTAFGELGEPPNLPYLVELPARGPGADMIGRAAGLLVDMPVDLQPSGWRLVDRAGRDLARTRAWLRQDLDVLAEVADGYSGPLKVQVAGPWTLAASLWLPRLERAVVDPGACRDLADSLAEGVARHVADVRRLVPAADVVVQVDEPMLRGVLAGALPTASGFGRLRAIAEPDAVRSLAVVLDAAATAGAIGTALHCCAGMPPPGVLHHLPGMAVSVDITALDDVGWEAIAVALDRGHRLWAGAVPSTGALPPVARLAEGISRPWHRIGLERSRLADVVVTPTCGLAGSTLAAARTALTRAREAAAALAEYADS